jgi:hypothetical protein
VCGVRHAAMMKVRTPPGKDPPGSRRPFTDGAPILTEPR